MRGKTKLISLAAMLSVIFVVSMVFASGLVNMSPFVLFSESPQGDVGPLSIPTVFIEPEHATQEYRPECYLNHSKVPNEKFLVHINITGVTDLYSYQINVTWPEPLNFTGVVTYGDFLARTDSMYGTSRDEPMVAVNYTSRCVAVAETILGVYSGINSGGRLVTLEFNVTGYGSGDIILGPYLGTGLLPTTLLNTSDTNHAMAFEAVGGYFRNRKPGDIVGDTQVVDGADYNELSGYWTYPEGPLKQLYGYNIECDLEGSFDGFVDGGDYNLLSGWWTYPKGPLDP